MCKATLVYFLASSYLMASENLSSCFPFLMVVLDILFNNILKKMQSYKTDKILFHLITNQWTWTINYKRFDLQIKTKL